MLPRTLNYRGLVRERKAADPVAGLADALPLYEAARKLHDANPRSAPVTRFITWYRLAAAADAAGRKDEAKKLIDDALGFVDAARLKTFGDATQRASFFGQFAPAFETAIEWCVRDGQPEKAFALLARTRSRTLLDQILTAGVDPLAKLEGAEGDALRKREAASRKRITTLRNEIQQIALDDSGTDRAKELAGELDKAQDDYALTWREVLNAVPLYRCWP